jgi:hypothetical protein
MKMLRNQCRGWTALALLIVAGAALRFFTWPWMGFSGDEAWTIKWAAQPVREIMRHLDVGLTMHLYILFMKGWSQLAGPSPHAWKFPSLIAGVLAIPILYVLARRHTGQPIALLAGLLLALSLPAIRFSRVARVYALLTLVALVSMALFHRVLTRGGRRPAFLLSLVNGLALMLSPNAAYLLMTQGSSLLIETRITQRAHLHRLAMIALSFTGSLALALIFYHGVLDQILPSGAQYTGGYTRSFGLLLNIFQVLHPVATWALAVLILLGSIGCWRKGPGARLLVLWTWVPLLVLTFIGASQLPVSALGRYLVPNLPAHFLLASLGAWGLAGHLTRSGRTHVAAAILLAPLALTVLLRPDTIKSTFQEPTSSHETCASLSAQVKRGDLVSADPDYLRWIIMSYMPNDRPSLRELAETYPLRAGQRLFLVTARDENAETVWRDGFTLEPATGARYQKSLIILKSPPLRDPSDLRRILACYVQGALVARSTETDPVTAERKRLAIGEYHHLLNRLRESPPAP